MSAGRYYRWQSRCDRQFGYKLHLTVDTKSELPLALEVTPAHVNDGEEAPAGMTTNGTPVCSMGFAMTYWGADRDILKFRCPHATGKVGCPLEIFFATLKKEKLYKINMERYPMAYIKSIIFRYIMVYYNRQRIYTSNPGGWPQQFIAKECYDRPHSTRISI